MNLALTTVLARLQEQKIGLGFCTEGSGLVHMMAERARAVALCGHPATRSSQSITLWGVETGRGERWCLQCAVEANELLGRQP